MIKKPKPPADIAEGWYSAVDKVEWQASDPDNTDDPRWLCVNAAKVRTRGRKLEGAAEHKLGQARNLR